MECLIPYLSIVTVPHIMVGLERMLDYRGVGLERFHCTVTMNKYGKRNSIIQQPPSPTLLSGPIECRIREVSLYTL